MVNETIYKTFLKSMPIWERSEILNVQIELCKRELNDLAESVENQSARFESLTRNKITSVDDEDIVAIYKKNPKTSQYERYVEVDSAQQRNSCPKDATILKLEEKVTPNEEVFAMVDTGKPWVRCRVVAVFRRPSKGGSHGRSLMTFRLREVSRKFRIVDVEKYSVARLQNLGDKLLVSKRVIAGKSLDNMMPGMIGQEPSEWNKYRYLVLMDDSSASYYEQNQVYPIFGQSAFPWLDSRYTGNNDRYNLGFLRHFLSMYPRRQLMSLNIGDTIEIFRSSALVSCKVINIDCDTMMVAYGDGTYESVHRGSARLIRRTALISIQLGTLRNIDHFDPHLLIMMNLYYRASINSLNEDKICTSNYSGKNVIIGSKRYRSQTARKSTASNNETQRIKIILDGQTVEEERLNILDLNQERVEAMKSHRCDEDCLIIENVKTESSIKDLTAEFRNESDLRVPLLLGWKRHLLRCPATARSSKGSKVLIVYEAPCGKIFQQPHDIRRYLIRTGSKFDIDYFSFDRELQLNRSLGEFQAIHYIKNVAVDKKTGEPLENKDISLINLYNDEKLPIDFEYCNKTFPHPLLKAKGFSFNNEFKSSCSCEDDCSQKVSCECHRWNEECFGTQKYNRGTVDMKCQYLHKRLSSQVTTGIFECNSNCKCSSKCANRVVQNGIRFRLQIYKTLSKGWGVKTLDDIPQGAFICTYSAELLDDADQYGDSDMYYADLDYISVLERQKLALDEGEKSDDGVVLSDSDSDGPPSKGNKPKRKKNINKEESEDSQSSQVGEDLFATDYVPGNGGIRYPKRNQNRPPNPVKKKPTSQRFKSIHELLDSHDFTLDARMQGNIGRFFNHSCDPNSIVQNVFIETHDLRFPTVAFFSNRTIRASDEITWDYNYKMGSIEGREMRCYCAASNCRGRIL